jgi:predicted membrane channel-forming protein YqfA (hemolysin III family)
MEEQVRRQTTEVSELETNRSKHCLGGSLCLSCSAIFDCIPKFHFLLALQLLNRSLTLILVAARFLPHLRFWKQSNGGSSKTNIWMATGLNCILLVFLWKLLFQLFWALLYVLLGWLTCKTVGSLMREEPATAGLDKWLRKISLYGMSGLGFYLAYRVGLLVQFYWHRETAGETYELEDLLVSPSSSEL